ncbi:glycosyltransferase family 2 protein [Hymenobacter sp.]|jgi:glycosyltransferase involved in cell wall biosynthesis|uniref:glycosyltransferase family 2 protein n=1 Tax=Hymenobacter sp. TaxID=1898978 RepID=UPI002EDB0954
MRIKMAGGPVHRVSVIIPNYNHARYLPQRIGSVLQQTFTDIEVIILDDCSPDESRSVIQHYAALDERIRVVYNEKNSGSTFKQWNKGFALAQGEYIWVAESDDYAERDLLEKLVQQLDKDPEVGLAYCDSTTVDEDNNTINVLDDFYLDLDAELWTNDFVRDGRSLIINFMSYRNIIPNASAVVIRKNMLDKVGKADESYKLNGDWVFWASIIADVKVAFVAEKLNYFRFHLNNVRSKTLANGLALSELTRVVRVMQQYGKPNQIFIDKMIDKMTDMWFDGIVKNAIPVKTSLKILLNIRSVKNGFNAHLLKYIKKHMLDHNYNGLKHFLVTGTFYKKIQPVYRSIKKKS